MPIYFFDGKGALEAACREHDTITTDSKTRAKEAGELGIKLIRICFPRGRTSQHPGSKVSSSLSQYLRGIRIYRGCKILSVVEADPIKGQLQDHIMVVSLECSELQQLHLYTETGKIPICGLQPIITFANECSFGGARYNRLINESDDFVEDRGSYKRLSIKGVQKFAQELEAGTPADGGSDRRSQLDTILESASKPQRQPDSSKSDSYGGFFNTSTRSSGSRPVHAPSPAHSDRDMSFSTSQELAELRKEREALKRQQQSSKALLDEIQRETAALRALRRGGQAPTINSGGEEESELSGFNDHPTFGSNDSDRRSTTQSEGDLQENDEDDEDSSSGEEESSSRSPGGIRASLQTKQRQQTDSDPDSPMNKAVKEAKQRSKDRSKQSSAATETSDWTKEEWAAWDAWEEEGPAETEVIQPKKSDKYAKEPKPVPQEGKLVLKRRAKAAAETEKQAGKQRSSTTGGSDTRKPLARQLSDGFGEQYVGSQGPEDSDCLVHAVNGFLNHDELDDRLRDKLAETIDIAEFLRLISDTVGLESYLALVVVPGTVRAAGKVKAKRIISERNITWAKGHADLFRQPWQDKAAEHSINNPADLVSRLDAMNQHRYLLEICEDDRTNYNHLVSVYKDEDGKWFRKDSRRQHGTGLSAGDPIAPIEALYTDHPKAIFMIVAMVPRRSEGPRGLDNLWIDPVEAETAPSSGGETLNRFRLASNHPDWQRWRAKADKDSKAGRPAMGPYSYAKDRKQRGKADTGSDSGQTEEEDVGASIPGKAHRGKSPRVPSGRIQDSHGAAPARFFKGSRSITAR